MSIGLAHSRHPFPLARFCYPKAVPEPRLTQGVPRKACTIRTSSICLLYLHEAGAFPPRSSLGFSCIPCCSPLARRKRVSPSAAYANSIVTRKKGPAYPPDGPFIFREFSLVWIDGHDQEALTGAPPSRKAAIDIAASKGSTRAPPLPCLKSQAFYG